MLNSWGYSSMGFGVCGVLGAQLAAPDRPCVAVVGDGGFTMAPYVLCTAVEYDLPCVWIIWNNFAWAAIRDLQYGLFDGREIGTAFYKGETGEPLQPRLRRLGARLRRRRRHRHASGRTWTARSSRRSGTGAPA